jgi:hypothetical protein
MTLRITPLLRIRTLIHHPLPIRNRRQSAREIVLCGFALIVLAFVWMALSVETVKPEWRDPEYGHRLKQLQNLQSIHPQRPLIVAVGSSRTQMGFSPAALDLPDEPGSPLAYNFAQSGAGPLHILLTVQRLLDDGIRPNDLLVELFPATLAHDGPAEQQFARIVPRLSLADLRRLEPYSRNTSAMGRQWAENRVNSWYSHRISLMSHWQPNWLPWQKRLTFQWQQMDAFGFTPYPYEEMPPGEREKGIEQVRKDYSSGLANLHIGTTSDRAIRDLIALCRSEGIRIAFYLMPESPSFRTWYSPATRATVAAYRDTLTRDLGVPVFDATTDFGETDFADGHHLLRHGAARFTRRLFAECILPWCGLRNGR